jgi:hypothetical protein
LKNGFEKLKKEKENIFSSSFGFWPSHLARPPFAAQLHPSFLQRREPVLLSPPRSLGRARRRPSLRGCACGRLSVADIPGPLVRVASFLKPSPASPSLFTTDRIRVPNLPLPFLEPLQGYISRVPHPSASISSSRSCCGARETGHREHEP